MSRLDRDGRPDPEQLLRQCEAEEQGAIRGKLKIFLGYSSGVGKSFRMFDEGRRRKERGQNVIVGAVQPNSSPEVQQLLNSMEVIPFRYLDGAPVMDVEAILRRRPQVCLVDGLAYDNPPGAPRRKRSEDIEVLLAAGISVVTSVNLQYIEEQATIVERITGKHVTQTVPEKFLRAADEIVIVDAPPEELEAQHGDLRREETGRALRLSTLREMALILAADVIDENLNEYLQTHGIKQLWGTQERVLVCITARGNPARMIASGKRNADRFRGDLIVAYVRQSDLSEEDQSLLERNFELARAAGAKIEILDADDPMTAIVDFARRTGVTQIFVGHSEKRGWRTRLFGTPLSKLIRNAKEMDVRVFPH